MKKIILLALAAIMIVGCSSNNRTAPNCGTDYHVYVIDSCEYIGVINDVFSNREFNYLAHKGNCRFCAERRKKELREMFNN